MQFVSCQGKKMLKSYHALAFATQAIFLKLAQPHGFENKFSAFGLAL